jgi:peptide/nickel transport system substrate-binding protein
VKPSIKKFIELPFTSDESEFSVLASGHGLTYGYLPSTAPAQQRRIEAEGYRVAPWTAFGWNYVPMNYNSPTYGPVYRQLYVREALQHLIDQPAWIRSFLGGYAVPTYSSVPLAPSNPFADSYVRHNPYPYSPYGQGHPRRPRVEARRRRHDLRCAGIG